MTELNKAQTYDVVQEGDDGKVLMKRVDQDLAALSGGCQERRSDLQTLKK